MDVVLVANTNGRLAIPALAGLLVCFMTSSLCHDRDVLIDVLRFH